MTSKQLDKQTESEMKEIYDWLHDRPHTTTEDARVFLKSMGINPDKAVKEGIEIVEKIHKKAQIKIVEGKHYYFNRKGQLTCKYTDKDCILDDTAIGSSCPICTNNPNKENLITIKT